MATQTLSTEPPSVFMSYSHDDEPHKDWVLQLATRLRSNGVDLILDRWNTKLGSDVASFMERGLSRSSRVISICSANYVQKANEGKGGAGYEKQIITAEYLLDSNTDWVIPLIRNNSGVRKTPTFLGSRIYIDFENNALYETKYEELLRDILNEPVLPIPEIGPNPFQVIKDFAKQKFIPSNERYLSPATSGEVTFDYSNNNGRFGIGQEFMYFECYFSPGNNAVIIIYSDPPSINTVCHANGVNQINEIIDARNYDISSRARRIPVNQVAVYQNSNGFYAAIKIIRIQGDEVTFQYKIQTNGSPDFRS